MGPSVQETLTQPVLFSSLPLTLHLSLSFYLPCSVVLSLTGREQGMLIKGCENQEKKGRARRDTEGNIAGKEWCMSQWIGNRAETDRWDFWQKQWPGNEWLRKKTGREREMKNVCTLKYAQHKVHTCVLGWVGGSLYDKLHHTRTRKSGYIL